MARALLSCPGSDLLKLVLWSIMARTTVLMKSVDRPVNPALFFCVLFSRNPSRFLQCRQQEVSKIFAVLVTVISLIVARWRTALVSAIIHGSLLVAATSHLKRSGSVVARRAVIVPRSGASHPSKRVINKEKDTRLAL